jgi:hypothetical protein
LPGPEWERMARIATVLCASHSPFLFATPEEWETGRQARLSRGGLSPEEPVESAETNRAKHARCMQAWQTLRAHLEAAQPDVLLIFGDDQGEQFTFANFPAFSLYTGDEFSGFKISPYFGLPVGGKREPRPKTPEHWTTVKSHPALAKSIMTGLMERGFDLAFSNELSHPDEGLGHAFMRPQHYLIPGYDLPIVAFSINCYFGPQPTASRCYELGRAVRAAIEAAPFDLRVAVLGSGGLWHLPNHPKSWLDLDFDRRILDGLRSRDPRAAATYFDSVSPPYDPSDANSVKLASGGTGMVLGWGGGTGETRNWIAAAGVAGSHPATIVDYVPIHASPIGAGFALWESV